MRNKKTYFQVLDEIFLIVEKRKIKNNEGNVYDDFLITVEDYKPNLIAL